MLYEQDWIAENMPYPDAPEEDWKDFDRAYERFREEQIVSP